MALPRSLRRVVLPWHQKVVRKLHDLRYLIVELTGRCNLRCLHCGSDCSRDSSGPDLPAEDLIRVLREIRGRYDAHKVMVALTGGEPLCYPGVFDLGRRIVEMEFPWGMVTNGWAWSRSEIEKAKAAGLHAITVSLDGSRESHDWLRGRTGSFERACRTIRMLTAQPFYRKMDVVTCVNRRNLPELGRLRDLLVELGVRRWRLFTVSPIGRAPAEPELFLSKDQYEDLLRFIQEHRGQREIGVSLSESGYLGHRFERTVRDQDYFCLAGIQIAGIMANGDILACPNIDRRFKQGHVSEDSFVQVWENRFEVFRDRGWMRVGQCAECGEWAACQGNSFHLWDKDRCRPRICHFRDYELGGGATPSR